jgi:hypothetical protein
MPEPTTLLPPLREIQKRLTANERERRLLRALERLALRGEEYDRAVGPTRDADCQTAPREGSR